MFRGCLDVQGTRTCGTRGPPTVTPEPATEPELNIRRRERSKIASLETSKFISLESFKSVRLTSLEAS